MPRPSSPPPAPPPPDAAHATLRASEERFRALLEHSSDAVILLDPAARILFATRSVERILGYTPEELTAVERAQRFEGEDAAVAAEALTRAMAQPGVPVRFDARARHKDGGSRVVEIVVVNRLDEPAVRAIVANVRDVTDERHAREQRDRFFELSLDLFAVVTLDGRIEQVNDAWERVLGYAKHEIAGRPYVEFLHPEDVATTTLVRQRLVAGTPLRRFENRYRCKDGSYRRLSWNSVTVGDRVYAAARDVSESRAIQEQLLMSQKMEAIGRLAGGVAHDFNNLLSVVTAYATLVLEELPEGSPLRADIAEIKRASDRAAELTGQMLAFSRAQVLMPRVLDLRAVVDDMERMLRRVIGEDIVLETRHCDRSIRVRADRGQLEQVVMNLAVNARDAMPSGGRLSIETGEMQIAERAASADALPPAWYVTLTVSDTGHGMDAATLSRIFEPFFTTKERGKGTGLGLATVYGIVKQSGGDIRVASEPGRGTSFTVILPRIDEPAPSMQPPAKHSCAPSGSETVLIVEDDPAVREIARKILARAGYDVEVAAGPQEALGIVTARGRSIAALLTDVVMPQMTGRELAARIVEQSPTIRVVFMSGYADRAFELGDVEERGRFLPKPFTAESLLRTIRAALDGVSGG